MASQAWERRDRFFSWRPVSISLLVLCILYGFGALLATWLGFRFSQLGQHETSRLDYWGAFWDGLVAILCFSARRTLCRESRAGSLSGAFALTAALFIVTRTFVGQLRRDSNAFFVIEAGLETLPILYCIIYALRKNKGDALF
jgi:hypothetical protein